MRAKKIWTWRTRIGRKKRIRTREIRTRMTTASRKKPVGYDQCGQKRRKPTTRTRRTMRIMSRRTRARTMRTRLSRTRINS